jgi:alpha,alpha-trehalase
MGQPLGRARRAKERAPCSREKPRVPALGVRAETSGYRWLSMIVTNAANYHGTVPEKYDVKSRSHRVFAEYGNVNTTFSYIADEGFGWMNASFVVGWNSLDDDVRAAIGED